MGNLRCINCENHALHELACNINHPNYAKRLKSNVNLEKCFVKSKLHESMDKVIEATDKLIKKLDK